MIPAVSRQNRIDSSGNPKSCLIAREPLFLGGGHQLAVPEEGRGGIVVEEGEAQDVHQDCLLKSSRSGGISGLGVQ